jgi:hypothetical protein
MAKVFGRVIEEEIIFLTEPQIEFVSLVKYAANRMPFKIIKKEEIMSEMLYRVFVPKDMEQEKLEELAKQHSFSVEKEEKGNFKQYRIFKQKDIEKMEEKETALVALDKENKIYAVVVAEKKEDIEKEYSSEQSLDDILRAMYAMEEIIYGSLTQPAAKQEERIDMIKKAIQNFMDFAMAVLETTKAEDVAEFEGVEKEEAEIKIGHIVSDTIEKMIEKLDSKILSKQEDLEKDLNNFKASIKEELQKSIEEHIKGIQEAIKEAGFIPKLRNQAYEYIN